VVQIPAAGLPSLSGPESAATFQQAGFGGGRLQGPLSPRSRVRRSGKAQMASGPRRRTVDILEIDESTSIRMLRLLKRVARWAIGLVLIVLGLVLSLPGIPGPGLLLALVGVFILMPESRWLRNKYVALERRYPRLFRPVKAWRLRRRHGRRAK
jgi:hypothetical protein